jgi:uncharacterized protein YkwD
VAIVIGACAPAVAVLPPETKPPEESPPAGPPTVEAFDPLAGPRAELYRLLNDYRASAGLPPLRVSVRLARAAQGHAERMAAVPFLDHRDPQNGSLPSDRVAATGYRTEIRPAEIFVAGQGLDTPADAMRWWLNSVVHRNTILTTAQLEMGIGYIVRSSRPFAGGYWVVNFGRPARDDPGDP